VTAERVQQVELHDPVVDLPTEPQRLDQQRPGFMPYATPARR
jgi:hypothetical protein